MKAHLKILYIISLLVLSSLFTPSNSKVKFEAVDGTQKFEHLNIVEKNGSFYFSRTFDNLLDDLLQGNSKLQELFEQSLDFEKVYNSLKSLPSNSLNNFNAAIGEFPHFGDLLVKVSQGNTKVLGQLADWDLPTLKKLGKDLSEGPINFKSTLLEKPELVEGWKKMDDLGADQVIKTNPGALNALNKPQFERPNPNSYLDQNFIDNHLSNFEGGVTKFSASTPTRPIGPPGTPEEFGGTFVLPKSQADDLLNQAGGNVNKLEDLLGLDRGTLGDNPVRIDVDNPTGLRMPSGNERGANGKWIPGGKTSGGVLEATVDQIPLDIIDVNTAF